MVMGYPEAIMGIPAINHPLELNTCRWNGYELIPLQTLFGRVTVFPLPKFL
jgi:hypothetical protein